MIQGTKFIWKMPALDEKMLASLVASCNGLSYPFIATLYQRGYKTRESIMSFLSVTQEQVADPLLLKGADLAVDRIEKAMERNEKILIFGDYDVDGITSTALMLSALLPLYQNINYHLPNRQRDGYGLSKKVVEKAARSGYHLIITVDNGITAFEAVSYAKECGLEVIITDHHRPHKHLPSADIIVNPYQEGCLYPYKEFAGVGVAFKIMDLLYRKRGLRLPEKAYELLMLGTIADVVPLINENRYWVQKGLSLVNEKKSNALQSLLRNGNLLTKESITARDIGFMVAPQLNALGRLDDPRDGVRFLISKNTQDIERIAKILKALNEERKRLDRSIYEELVQAVELGHINLKEENIIIAGHDTWPTGVIGLVAGKLVQEYGRPAILLHTGGNQGIAKGSCRSIEAFSIFEALEANKELLLSFGGHACAAGLSLKVENIPYLKERLEEKITTELTPEELKQAITIDAHVSLTDINHAFIAQLKQLEPFGHTNPEPCFVFPHCTLLKEPQLLKDKHVKCLLFEDGVIKPVIFFNRPDLYQLLKKHADKPFKVAAHVTENYWNDTSTVQLQGVDIAFN